MISGSNSMNVLPRMFRRTLRYSETYTLTTGVAGVVGTVQNMSLNSAYDPNQSGTGHQPYGFDQLAAFYNKYIVHSVRYRLLCTTLGGTAEVAVCFGIIPTGGTGLAGYSVDTITERAMCSVFPVGPSGNDRARLVQGRVQIHRVFGVSKRQYLDNLSQYAGSTSGNPTNLAAFQFGVGSYSGTSGETLSVQLTFDMDIEFFDPVTMPAS